MGHGEVVDSMINDGLWCSFENWHMGKAGEVVATECGIGRQAQDAYALESHRRRPRPPMPAASPRRFFP